MSQSIKLRISKTLYSEWVEMGMWYRDNQQTDTHKPYLRAYEHGRAGVISFPLEEVNELLEECAYWATFKRGGTDAVWLVRAYKGLKNQIDKQLEALV